MAAHAFYYYTPDRVMTLISGEDDAVVESRADAWAIAFRDLFRDGDGENYQFNQGLPVSYKVSDVGKFSNSSRDGYAFIIRDTNAGCEWLILFSGYDNSANIPSQIFYILPGFTQGFAYYQDIKRAPDNTGYNTDGGWGISVLYNPDYATSTFDMGFDNATDLTYSGGDLTTVAALPATSNPAVEAFMPSTTVKWPRGLQVANTGDDLVNGADLMIWIDEDEPCLNIALTAGASGAPNYFGKLGNFINPDDVADTYEQGAFWVETASDFDDAGDPLHSEGYVDSFAPDGTPVFDLNITPANNFTRENEKTVGDELKWRRVGISNGGLVKGEFKDDSAREVSAFNDRSYYRQLFAEDPSNPSVVFYKITDSVAFRYVLNIPAFPFTYPTKK